MYLPVRQRLPALLQKLRLDHTGTLRVEGTPRRLVAMLEGLAPRQKADESRVRGPPASVSFKGESEGTARIGEHHKGGSEGTTRIGEHHKGYLTQ